MELNKNQKGGLVIGSVALILGLSYLGYRLYLSSLRKINNENFLDLESNIGIKPNKDDVIITKFNNGENKAQFYTSNRVVIFNKDNMVLIKGSFSDGGKTIVLDNGKTVSSGSVWTNLLSILKLLK